jgi:hypothetical protein
MKQVYLTLGSMIRNVENYVQEWLTFYHIIGVERFVLILHQCEDKTEQKILELPFRKKINIHYYKDIGHKNQYLPVHAYRFIHDKYGEFTKWMLFIDSDEFYFGTVEDFLPDILERYEEFGGLSAHWLAFGSNGHVLRPKELSIEAFIRRKPDNHPSHRGVKTAYQPSKIVTVCSSHIQITKPPTVREHFDTIDMNTWYVNAPPTYDIVRCNHYYTRSMEDWVQRVKNRLETNIYNMRPEFGLQEFINHTGGVEDHTILRFADRLKTKLSCNK